jgi:hypothetical protein
MAELTNPSKEAYCKRWGYQFECFEGTLDDTRPPAWSKIRHVLNLLDRYDWVFWLDADALIMNQERPVEDLLDDGYNMILVKHPGLDRFGNLHLNTGSFFIKSDDWSRSLLKEVYAQAQFTDHPFWEQEAFMSLYRERPDLRERIKVEIQARKFNSIANSYAKGDFVFHAISPMRTEQGKIDLIQNVLLQDMRIPDETEPGIGIALIYHEEEERDLLEFTLPSFLMDNAGIECNSLHFIKAYERSFGEAFGWEEFHRYRMEYLLDLLRTATQELILVARPGSLFFPGWRRRLLTALGTHDLAVATNSSTREISDHVLLFRKNSACESLLQRCLHSFRLLPPNQRRRADAMRILLADQLNEVSNHEPASWATLPTDLVMIGSGKEIAPLQLLASAIYSIGPVSGEQQRNDLRAVASGCRRMLDNLRQTIVSD